jgi:hypothetical protein
MNLQDLLPQYAQPLEITHQARWIDLLRDKSPNASFECLPPLPSSAELRTLVATLPEQLQAADDLVRRRYAWRGYHVPPEEVPSAQKAVTLIAENQGALLGTLTVRPHGPLLAEKTYGAEIARLRDDGYRLGEVVKLAVETGVDWKGALDALVQAAYLVSHILHALTDVIIEVNPRHVRFYEKVLGFVQAATGGVCSRVGAPSVLMRLDLAGFGARVRATASQPF